MVSIKTIAQKAGVSVAMVSRVLNNSGYVKAEKRDMINKVLKESNFTPNSMARSLVTRQSRILGIMIPHIKSPFFEGLVTAVEYEARKHDYRLLLCHTSEDAKIEKRCLELLVEHRVDGILVTPVGREYKYWKTVVKTIPTVMVARVLPKLNVPSVEVNDKACGYNLMRHLIAQGHRRIGFVNMPLFISSAKNRWEGMLAALRDFDIPLREEFVGNDCLTGEDAVKATEFFLELKQPPTAIVCLTSPLLIGSVRAVKRRGCLIPSDVAIASIDSFDDSEVFKVFDPPVTGNIHPVRKMGELAFGLFLEQKDFMQENKLEDFPVRHIVIPAQLATRESTVGQNGAITPLP
jgi:DNA-binding LacI/PurR family transcriptional regulator